MLGLLLVGGATLFEEVGVSLGKRQTSLKLESVFTMGFLNSLWATIILLALAFLIPAHYFAPGFPSGFVFVQDSLPTFIPRVILEIAQAHATVYAISRADRSTYGFLRILTIPLLLVADLLLLYPITLLQISGMSLIIVSLILLFINHGIEKRGAWLVLFTAINAVLTISLYKYDITHFNSAAAEQAIVSLILIIYFFVMALLVSKENPLRLFRKPVMLVQSSVMGIAGTLHTFAYLYGTASVITSATRAFSILYAIISGNVYFGEKKAWIKILSFLFILSGLVLLAG